MITEIEKKTAWQEPYNDSDSLLGSAYFQVGQRLYCYSLQADKLRLFRNSETGNFLVESQISDGTIIRTTFYQHQLLGVVTYKIYRHK